MHVMNPTSTFSMNISTRICVRVNVYPYIYIHIYIYIYESITHLDFFDHNFLKLNGHFFQNNLQINMKNHEHSCACIHVLVTFLETIYTRVCVLASMYMCSCRYQILDTHLKESS